jgi:peptide/nickel transport system substrate-binding protein
MGSSPRDQVETLLDSPVSRRRFLGASVGAATAFALGSNLAMRQELFARQDDTRPVGGDLKFALSNEPPNLDPHQASALLTSTVDAALLDTLVNELNDGTIVPGLALSWEVAPDGLSVTFKLREGVTFHDGEAFNATAMKTSFDRMVDPATKSGLAGSLLGPYTGSEVIDEATLKMNFSTPFAPLFHNLARNFTAPISPKAIADFGLDVATHPIGTGPFMFTEWVQKDHMTFDRNPNYNWAPDFFGLQGPAALEKITWRFVAEEATRIATLRNGEANAIESVPPAFVGQFEGDDNFAIDKYMNTGIPFCFMVNTHKPPTDDPAVRQAMEYAIDKDTISNTINFGVYPPARSVLSPVTFGYWAGAESMYPYDPEQAKTLLEGAGWIVGDGGVREKNGTKLQMQFWTLSDIVLFQNVAQIYQAQLKEVGIEMEIVSLARAAWGEGVNGGEHNLTVQIFGLSDPTVLSINFHSKNIAPPGGSGFNWARFNSPELDALLDAGDVELDDAKRVEIYAQAQKMILDNAIMIPVYLLHQVFGRSTKLQNITYVVGGLPMLYSATLQQ